MPSSIALAILKNILPIPVIRLHLARGLSPNQILERYVEPDEPTPEYPLGGHTVEPYDIEREKD